ncbi:germinal-center associated nuclear protein-like [Daphnia carinata]|uniref:germinal-center associated nuclear protein-like n=1 Tax=Daphnia carinata TaxID=120202 RepID=UPI00257D459F|nr:germinal-center associated nuclear protein-like [Daphnia carinata]
MRSQGRKQNAPESLNSKNDLTVAASEDSEFIKLSQKKSHNVINLAEGLPIQITKEQLKAILTQPASNVADKVVLLDARDRLLRLTRDIKGKTGNAKKAITLRGTCLDMCPEKERYSRAEKHRLALFEMLVSDEKDYEVDHRLAVKEYSRSSADQAEPLAHELRPLPVLQMTMDYLIARIVNRCDKPGENLAEWFNFLWDRMRGIRKDITQQSLCEQGSVDLVEKCARFHIHCTSRLCELDMQDFDQKINDENLTKCLQTLKHMYYDLSVKNIFCPNEAEFRSYDVLLHLNDGEILREVLQLRAEVRDSPEVRSALEFVNALNSRNYVRFFKLVRSNQDYLQCCLLQRYFNQMRNQALQIMLQAYGPPKKGQIQLNNLVSLLGYEDEEEAGTWCECHGLPIDFDKKAVKFDRTSFIELPEKFPPMRRSSIIESKRTSSVSKCIAKNDVPEDPTLHHTPFNSFDSNGMLLQEAWLAEEHEELVTTIAPPAVPSTTKPPASISIVPNLIENITMRIHRELISSTVYEITKEIALQVAIQNAKVQTTHRIFKQCLNDFVSEFCSELVSEVLFEMQTAKFQEQHKLNLEHKVRHFSVQIFGDIVDNVVHDQVKSLCIEEIQMAARLHDSAIKEKHARRLLEALVSELIAIESRVVASDVACEAVKTREIMVSRVLDLTSKRKIRRCIAKWRRFTALQMRRRKEKQTFPACPSRMVFSQQIASLKSKGESPGVSLKRKSLVEQSVSVKRCNSLSDLQFNLKKISLSLAEKKFDLFPLLERSTSIFPLKERNRCWKLIILAINNEEVGEFFRHWFGFSGATQTTDGWLYTETRTNQNRITLCVRFATSYQQISELLLGANALLVVYDPTSEVETTLHSLAQLVQVQSKYFPLSVASIASKNYSKKFDYLVQILNPCYHTTLSFEESSIDKHCKLIEVFTTLVEAGEITAISPASRVCTTTMWELANSFISHKVLPTIYRDMQLRLKYNLPHQSLARLLNFYNHAVKCLLENVLSDSELGKIRWPAPEFVKIPDLVLPPVNWNSKASLYTAKQSFERYLVLPYWQSDDHDFPSLCASLCHYCTDISIGTDVTALLSRIDSVLMQAKQHYEKRQPSRTSFKEIIPWTDIFQACVDYRLQEFADEGSSKLIGYFPRALDKIQSNAAWIRARGFLEPTEQLCAELDAQRFDYKETEVSFYQQSKSLDVPDSIATLCAAIADTSKRSRQENKLFESILLRVHTPEKKPVRCSPVKQFTVTPSGIEDRYELLEIRLEQSRCEDKQFESYLKRALEDF